MKLIFVTQRIDEAVSYAERRDALDQRWAVLLEKLGCAALPVPNHPKTAAALLERVRPDGILLTGGNDPASCGGNAPERDETDARQPYGRRYGGASKGDDASVGTAAFGDVR